MKITIVCYLYLLQFSNENPPQCSWATVPPIAAMLKIFVESSLVCMCLQHKPLTYRGLCWSSLSLLSRWRNILSVWLPFKFSILFRWKNTNRREQELTFVLLKFLGPWWMAFFVLVSSKFLAAIRCSIPDWKLFKFSDFFSWISILFITLQLLKLMMMMACHTLWSTWYLWEAKNTLTRWGIICTLVTFIYKCVEWRTLQSV